jgi:hypothetical protein
MKLKHAIVLLALFLCVPSAFAQSPRTYTYVGNPFINFSGDSCPPECSISISFTVSQPLAPNLPWPTSISPTSFTITDGNTLVTQATGNGWQNSWRVVTDANGNIISWQINVDNPNEEFYLVSDDVILEGGSAADETADDISGEYAYVGNPGTWVSPNQSFVIESSNTEPSAEVATSSDPGATVQCTVTAPCPQKLQFVFDTINGQQFVLGSPNVLWGTNSTHDTGTAVNVSNLCGATNNSISVVNGDGTSYLFSFTGGPVPCLSTSSNPSTGTYCLTSSSFTNCNFNFETGPFSMYAYPAPSGTYVGTFNDAASGHHTSAGGSGDDIMGLTINSDFSVTSTLLALPYDLCPQQSSTLNLTSTDPLALTYAAYPYSIGGIQVGDVTLAVLGDGTGNVLAIIAGDQDAYGNVLPAGNLYVTGYGVSGVCAGTYFYDRPFAKKGTKAIPIRRTPPHHRLNDRFEREFDEKSQNREQAPPRLAIPILKW